MNHIHTKEHDKNLLLDLLYSGKRDQSPMVKTRMISANILGSEQVKIDPRRVPSSFVFTGFGLIVDGCCLQDVGVSVQPLALPTMPALVSSHTVGRVWGTCWEVLSCNYSHAELLVPECELRSWLVRHLTLLANASWCQDVWQRDDALRCSLGVPGILGQHVVRGGQML